MSPATGRACGKLILLGEHAVVYGHRAIAAAVSRGVTVTLTPRPGPTRLERGPADARLAQVLALALPAEGLGVDIHSELPTGRGMGSSAALSVALLRARAALAGRTLDFDTLHHEGFALERIFHGNPSGLDHAVCALGGAVLYRRGEAPTPLPMPSHPVVVLDSGAAGDTSALVAAVAARRPGVDSALAGLGALVEQALGVLDQPAALGALLLEAHALLRQLGVSTPALDALVALAMDHGATGAKLAGAGGGGVVLALTPDGGEALLREARRRDISAFCCRLPEA